MISITLIIQCPDQKGIIAEVTQFIYRYKGNILYIDQYVDRENKAFFMRLESEFNGDLKAIEQFQQAFADSLIGDDEEKQLAMPPSQLQEFITIIRKKYEEMAMQGETPVLLTSPGIRQYVRSIVERFRPQTTVMSQNEIYPKAKIKTLGQI